MTNNDNADLANESQRAEYANTIICPVCGAETPYSDPEYTYPVGFCENKHIVVEEDVR
jgi:hypothetical protein